MMLCGVLLAGHASAITLEVWTTFDQPYQQVYVLGVLDAWMNLEQTRIEGREDRRGSQSERSTLGDYADRELHLEPVDLHPDGHDCGALRGAAPARTAAGLDGLSRLGRRE
jgi:hypothetical protein